ncbi:hypothetical protein SUNI508_01792 [Seiridium unicorne]|uniref:Uncharacterized protein n=1 Tax=Seiridium unicorne TaxID=138068 RepID=A0ABR2UP09_9PEZI
MSYSHQYSRRPSLEPVWTSYRHPDGMPHATSKPAISPDLTASPMSSQSLPSPMYPSSYGGNMIQHERAMVNSFDERSRSIPMNSASLRPIDEGSSLSGRFERTVVLPPLQRKYELPSPLLEPKTINPHRGPPESPSLSLGRSNSTSMERRPLPPPPPAPRKQSVLQIREQLRDWGHVYYGNVKTADAFIIARSLRQNSVSPLESKRVVGWPKYKAPNSLTVRAIIRPQALERQSFLIQRTFDTDELRATIPDPVYVSPLPAIPERRVSASSAGASPRLPHGRRRSSVKSSELLSGRGRASASIDYETLIRDTKAVPIHLKYARAYLPVVAALLVSGHVREGDIIYLPLPHAEAWPQTVEYIYTGQGELTGAIRENIVYLAGKI